MSPRRIVLARRPSGLPVEEDFRVEEVPRPVPGPGEVLVRVVDLSLDPYIRSSLTGRDLGHAPVHPGELVPGRALVRLDDGSWALAEPGWQEEAAVPVSSLRPVTLPPDGVPRSAVLSTLGMPGLTAYAVVVRLLRPRVGDTVVVSSAVGGVGSVVGQLVRLAGARAVAIVSGPEKCRIAVEELGYAAAVDRRDPAWRDALAAACPDRVDGYVHMAGGDVLDGVVRRLAPRARVALVGLPDHSNEAGQTVLPAGPVVAMQASVHGFVVYDHEDLRPEFTRRVGRLVASGELRVLEERHDGLGAAPAAFARLMAGGNRGKVVVGVGPP